MTPMHKHTKELTFKTGFPSWVTIAFQEKFIENSLISLNNPLQYTSIHARIKVYEDF